jgi:hypothetical protein
MNIPRHQSVNVKSNKKAPKNHRIQIFDFVTSSEGNSYLISSLEIFLNPFKYVITGEMCENALIQVRASSTSQVVNVVNVDRNLPDARERFGGTLKMKLLILFVSNKQIYPKFGWVNIYPTTRKPLH